MAEPCAVVKVITATLEPFHFSPVAPLYSNSASGSAVARAVAPAPGTAIPMVAMSSLNDTNPPRGFAALEVHSYDAQCKSDIRDLRVFTRDEKLGLFRWLYDQMEEIKQSDLAGAQMGLDLIVNSIGQSNNYDSTNLVYADDVLANIVEYLQIVKPVDYTAFESTMNGVIEQTMDMFHSGQCASGRTIRLIQIWNHCWFHFENTLLKLESESKSNRAIEILPQLPGVVTETKQ